jgi:glycosyltransferase involved in cell wall biosynthesis
VCTDPTRDRQGGVRPITESPAGQTGQTTFESSALPRERVVYVTTREVTYARNQTLIAALSRYAKVDVVAPYGTGEGFDQRLTYVWGLLRVLAGALGRALRPDRRRDTLVIGFLAQPLILLLAPLWRGRVIADAMVSVYDTVCCDKQLARPESLIGRISWWLDSHLVRSADALLFDTRAHRDYFTTFSRRELPPACIVPVGARRLKEPAPTKATSDRLQVLFAGSYIPLQGSRVILEAARLLRQEPVDFTLVGSGQEYEAATRFTREQDLRNVRFVGWVTLEALDDWYHRADVILGIFGRTQKTQRVIPNKVFEALSIGQPVITGETPAIRELLQPGRDVVCCAVDDPAALADAIRWAASHRTELREIGRAGQRAVQQHASPNAVAAAIRPLFDGRRS